MHWTGILLYRMVRDDCDTVVQSQTPNCAAGTKSHTQPTEDDAGPAQAPIAESVNPESQETAGRQLDPLYYSQLSFEDEPESWQVGTLLAGAVGGSILKGQKAETKS